MAGTSIQKQLISLPPRKRAGWRESLPSKLSHIKQGDVALDCGDWNLGCRELKQLKSIIEQSGMSIEEIYSVVPETIVSATALGYQAQLILPEGEENFQTKTSNIRQPEKESNVLFHEGTLRSGEQLEIEGDVLLLGDVNPGASISATGDVMVFGRLLGKAHAGKGGNPDAKITALELKPLQLRIGDQIARGPEEKPKEGFAEEARLIKGQILIQPAKAAGLRKKSS